MFASLFLLIFRYTNVMQKGFSVNPKDTPSKTKKAASMAAFFDKSVALITL